MLVYGYHGTTDIAVADIKTNGWRKSPRDSLWLGHGVYLFQDGHERAMKWARSTVKKQQEKGIKSNPVVIRIGVDLSGSIDWFDRKHHDRVERITQTWLQTVNLRQLPFSDNFIIPQAAKLAWNYDDHDLWSFVVDSYISAGENPTSIRVPFAEGFPIFKTSWVFDEASAILNVIDPKAIKSFEIISL